jgi:hypothetical protein
MRIPGERIKRTRLIQTDQYVVAVEVEMVIPPDELREVKVHAEQGDLAWLTQRGKLYAEVGAS